jgi:hypothetical protein
VLDIKEILCAIFIKGRSVVVMWDLQYFLKIYDNKVKSNAPKEKVRGLVELAQKTLLVFEIISH